MGQDVRLQGPFARIVKCDMICDASTSVCFRVSIGTVMGLIVAEVSEMHVFTQKTKDPVKYD